MIVPSYNEEANVPLLARELRDELAKAGIDSYEVLFVDDGSRDATADRARDEAVREPGRFRLVRLAENCGESAATVLGVSCALGGDSLLFVIDRKVPHFHLNPSRNFTIRVSIENPN